MKRIFIYSLIILLIGFSLGITYFLYQKNHLLDKSSTEKINLPPELLNYRIPVADITQIQPKLVFPSSGLTTPSTSILSTPAPKKPPVLSQNYLTFYQSSINNINKISNTTKTIQQILEEMDKKYKEGDEAALYSLISEGTDENLIFAQNTSDLKNSLDNWSVANKQTTDELIKSKTEQVIKTGKDYSQSTSGFSEALGKILAFKGVGDINQISQELQSAAQKMSDDGKNLNKLFTELNNLLENL